MLVSYIKHNIQVTINSKDELTYKVPQKDAFLEETSCAEAMVKELLHSSD